MADHEEVGRRIGPRLSGDELNFEMTPYHVSDKALRQMAAVDRRSQRAIETADKYWFD